MKIKDIKRKSNRLSNEEAINYLYFLFDWYSNYFNSINVSYCDDENLEVNFNNIKEAVAFIDDLELEQLDRITCDVATHDFSDSDITIFEIIFYYDRFGPEYAVITVTPKNFKNVGEEKMDVNRLDLERVNQAEKLLHEFEKFSYSLAKDGYTNLGEKMTFELYKLAKEKEFHDSLFEEMTHLYNLIYED